MALATVTVIRLAFEIAHKEKSVFACCRFWRVRSKSTVG